MLFWFRWQPLWSMLIRRRLWLLGDRLLGFSGLQMDYLFFFNFPSSWFSKVWRSLSLSTKCVFLFSAPINLSWRSNVDRFLNSLNLQIYPWLLPPNSRIGLFMISILRQIMYGMRKWRRRLASRIFRLFCINKLKSYLSVRVNYFVVLRTQYTVVAVAYSIGRPFRQSLRRRYLLVAALIITGLSSTFMLLL